MIRTLAFFLLLVPAQDKRKIPPPGVPISETDRAEIEAGLKELSKETLIGWRIIGSCATHLTTKPSGTFMRLTASSGV